MAHQKQRRGEEQALPLKGRPRKPRRQLDQQVRRFHGELTKEAFDQIAYEEEFDTFEALPRPRKSRQ